MNLKELLFKLKLVKECPRCIHHSYEIRNIAPDSNIIQCKLCFQVWHFSQYWNLSWGWKRVKKGEELVKVTGKNGKTRFELKKEYDRRMNEAALRAEEERISNKDW